jgi:tetratricopeptide (TPR) repeat protein
MVKGAKITKKKLKEPDEFITLTQRAIIFIEDHSKKILIGTGVLVVILAFIFFQIWNQKKKEAEASQKLSVAMETYQKVSSPYREGSPSEYKGALGDFDEVIKKFPGTSAETFSLVYKGNIHLKLGEFDEAIKAYQTFLEKVGKEKFYRVFALEGLGYAYEGKKDYGKAAEAYQQMVGLGETFLSGNAYLSLGRCYEKLGKNAEALQNYKAYLKTSKSAETNNTVLGKISLLEK